MTDKQTLKFGYNAGLPDGVTSAWGARLIYPNDLLWDRQDAFGNDKVALQEWLNSGPLKSALEDVRSKVGRDENRQVVLYEDERGRIVANPNGSYGYLYVCAYLFEHTGVTA